MKGHPEPASTRSWTSLGEILADLPLAVVVLDRACRVHVANAEMARLLGADPHALAGRPLPGLSDADRASLAGAIVDQDGSGSAVWRHLELTLPAVGRTRCHCRHAAWYAEDGRSRGLVAVFLPADHADRALQSELRRRNEFIESVLQNLPIGLAINSLDMSTMGFVNTRFEEIYGNWYRTGVDDLATFLDRLCPDPDQRRRLQRELLASAGEGGDLRTMQWDDIRVRDGAGKLRIVSAENTPLSEQGLMISTVRDVTDRKLAEEALRESERRYQVMAEASPVGIFRCGLDSRCRYVNRRWREITGLTTAEAATDGWLSAVHQDETDTVTRAWQQAVASGQIFRTECRFRRPRGVTTWVFVQAEPVHEDPRGHPARPAKAALAG